jgi:hypothetical protein
MLCGRPAKFQDDQSVNYLNFTIKDLLMIIPVERWPRTQASFTCPIPHCGATETSCQEHFHMHEAPFNDNLFSDPFMIALSALIGWRLQISNCEELPCPFCGLGRDFKSRNIDEIHRHTTTKLENEKIFLAQFGTFCGSIS